MILFQLRCDKDHLFEAWFRDNAAYDDQAAAGRIVCPHCGETRVDKAIMAPRLSKATGQALDAREARRMLAALRQTVEANCDHVGERFPEEARRIHYGETEARPIYGEATSEQADALAEEGIAVQRIPWLADEN